MNLELSLSLESIVVQDSADGAAVDPNVTRTRVIDTFFADGTWTKPATFWNAAGAANRALVQAWAGGAGATAGVGAGGGGAESEDDLLLTDASYGWTGLAGGGVNANSSNVVFGSNMVVAAGALSGANGGTGGQAAACVGSSKRSGGNGQVGTGNTIGGGGAGSAADASGTIGGAPEGASGGNNVRGRGLGSGGGGSAGAATQGSRGEGRVTYDIPATAGYLRRREHACARDAANATSRPAPMPSNIVAGERLLLVVISDQGGAAGLTITETGGGWTALAQVTDAANEVSARVFHKIAAGGDTATIATSASEKVKMFCVRLNGAGVPEQSSATGSSTNADSPQHTRGASAKCLVFSIVGWDGSSTAFTLTGAPASYGNVISLQAEDVAAVSMAIAERFVESDTENPGAWTSATEQWVALTLMVPPA